MALKFYRNSTWRDLTRLHVFRNGAWRQLKTLKVYRDGQWRLIGNFAPPLSLSAPDVINTGFNSVETGSSTATPSGGVAPYSYNWSKVSGTTMTVTGANTATAGFASPTLAPGQEVTAVYQCVCTDSAGQTATADINITFAFNDPRTG